MHGHLNVKFVKSKFFVISEVTDYKENNISLLFFKAFRTLSIFHIVGVSSWHYVLTWNGIGLNIDCFLFMKKTAHRVTET